MALTIPPVGYNYNTFTSTISIPQAGILGGILVSSSTAATITITDGANTVLPVTGSLTIASPQFINIPAMLSTGLTITVTGTISATVFWV